ncbi:MAG: N-acetylmuramoyl-L-alanine amidase [Phycisphaerales bacterium]|nr:N-acetylmuramoyl-L-alanine amidase [Phycisphaerales bacterium]
MRLCYCLAHITMVLILCGSCSTPYKFSNNLYLKEADSFANDIRKRPKTLCTDTIPKEKHWIGTVNFNMRRPNFVIIHHTAQDNYQATIKAFTKVKSQVSAHYLIAKDGRVFHFLNDYLRAYHAGVSQWGNLTDLNSGSIGIELDNNGYEYFTEPQINSLISLLHILKTKYKIPTANFIGHGDIAPGRKNDPNVYFPWQQLAQEGFGYWYDTANIVLPRNFNAVWALKIVGYHTKDSFTVFNAFKRHFLAIDDTLKTPLNITEKKVLYAVMLQYLNQ